MYITSLESEPDSPDKLYNFSGYGSNPVACYLLLLSFNTVYCMMYVCMLYEVSFHI